MLDQNEIALQAYHEVKALEFRVGKIDEELARLRVLPQSVDELIELFSPLRPLFVLIGAISWLVLNVWPVIFVIGWYYLARFLLG